MFNRLKQILNQDTSLIELMSSMMALIMGLGVLNPFTDSIQSGTSSASGLSELGWGFFLAIIGAIQLIGLLSRKLVMRKAGAMVATFLWGFIVVVSDMNIVSLGIFAPLVFGSILAVRKTSDGE